MSDRDETTQSSKKKSKSRIHDTYSTQTWACANDATLDRINPICERFEDDWQELLDDPGGNRPNIKTYLPNVPESDRPSLFRYLLELEVEYRGQAGEMPVAEDYHKQFPEYQQSIVECLGIAKIPQSIGKYKVVEKLGAGGQAEVFRVIDPNLGRQLAIKRLLPSVKISKADRQRLISEGKVMAGLKHPNLVHIVDIDFDEGRPFMVMEYLDGQNLRQYSEQHDISPKQTARMIAKVARAVSVAHAKGIAHLDIKPDNIVLDENGEPRLLDFGIADQRHAWNPDQQLPTGISGTVLFMAPEQARGESTGPKSDVFALGAVMYSMLTGRSPFQASNIQDALELARQGKFDRAALERSSSWSLASVCLKAMELDPKKRPKAVEFADALEKNAGRRSHFKTFAMATAAILLLVASFVAFDRLNQDEIDVQPQESKVKKVDLIAAVDPTNDRRLLAKSRATGGSHWTMDNNAGLLRGEAKQKKLAVLQFPSVVDQFEYQLTGDARIEVTPDESEEYVAMKMIGISLPLPNGSLNLMFQGKRVWIEDQDQQELKTSDYEFQFANSINHHVEVNVVATAIDAVISVNVDKRRLLDWSGNYRTQDKSNENWFDLNHSGVMVRSAEATFSNFYLNFDSVSRAGQYYREGLTFFSNSDREVDLECAIEAFSNAINEDHEFKDAVRERSVVYMRQRKLAKAKEDAERAIELDRKDSTTHLILGKIHAAEDSFDAALLCFNESIQTPPELSIAYRERSWCHLVKGQFDEAVSDLKRSRELAPNDTNVFVLPKRYREKLAKEDLAKWLTKRYRAMRTNSPFSLSAEVLGTEILKKKTEEWVTGQLELVVQDGNLEAMLAKLESTAELFELDFLSTMDSREIKWKIRQNQIDERTFEVSFSAKADPGFEIRCLDLAPKGDSESHFVRHKIPVEFHFEKGEFEVLDLGIYPPGEIIDKSEAGPELQYADEVTFKFQIIFSGASENLKGYVRALLSDQSSSTVNKYPFELMMRDKILVDFRNTTSAPVQLFKLNLADQPVFQSTIPAYQSQRIETAPGKWVFEQFGVEIGKYTTSIQPVQDCSVFVESNNNR